MYRLNNFKVKTFSGHEVICLLKLKCQDTQWATDDDSRFYSCFLKSYLICKGLFAARLACVSSQGCSEDKKCIRIF